MRWIAVALIAACGHSAPAGDDVQGDAASDDSVATCPAGQWCVETAPIPGTTLLHTVFALPGGDVIAVGDGGTIIARHAGAWTQLDSHTTEDLRGVWGASATDAWAVGANATVLHFDGSAWTVVAVPELAGADLFAIWGSTANDVWVVGSQIVGHYDGAWTNTTLIGDHNAVTGSSPTDVWVVGENEKPQHFDGSWQMIDAGVGSLFFAAFAVSSTEVWVTDPTPGKQAVVWNGSTWMPQSTATTEFPTGAVFQALWGSSTTDLWGVGATKAGHWDGAAWTLEQPAGAGASLYGITGRGNDIFVVGQNALILHRD